jgi:hypothetical protein
VEQPPRQPVTMQALALSLNERQIHGEPQLPMADWEQPVTMSLNHFSAQQMPPCTIPMNCHSMSQTRTISNFIRWMMQAAIPRACCQFSRCPAPSPEMQRLPQLQKKQQLPENPIPQPPEEPMPQPPQQPKQPRKQPMTQPPQPPQQTGAGAAARTRAQLASSCNKINKQAQCPHYRPMPRPGKIPQPPRTPKQQQQTLRASALASGGGDGAGSALPLATAARTRSQLAPSSNKINKQAQCPHYRPMPRPGKIPQPPQPPQPPKQQQHTLRASALAAGAGPELPPLRALTLAASAGPAARGANSGPETPQLPSSNKINLNKQASGVKVRRMRAA